jgi:hypothetical protein
MPREITHWLILDDAKKMLPTSDLSAASKCMYNFPAAAYLGAIAHDAPYYLRWGKDRAFEMLAESLHGSYKEDTFDPVRDLAREIVCIDDLRKREMHWSFLLGFISHYIVDVVFHPMVLYFTGNYYHKDYDKRKKAQTHHRMFEVYLDSWFRDKCGLWNQFLISEVIDELGDDFFIICSLLEKILIPEKRDSIRAQLSEISLEHNRWKRSFLTMSDLQKLFFSNFVGMIVRIGNKLTFDKFSRVDSLFSYNRWESLKFFNANLDYLNPLTGVPNSLSVTQLREMAALETLGIFNMCEPLIRGDIKDVDSAIGGVKGMSLHVGEYRVEPSMYNIFSDREFKLK